MTDRWTDTEISSRLQSVWSSELTRADADYQALPERTAPQVRLLVPAGAIAIIVAVLALAIVFRQSGTLPSPGFGATQLGIDGVPVRIGGEAVLRGDQIAQHLAEGPATPFLAGGRLVVVGTGCSTTSSAASCVEHWQLLSADGSGPIFSLEVADGAGGFVRTSGALTVLRAQPVERATCGATACSGDLLANGVEWREPTKGRLPANAAGVDGAIYDVLWPDFVATFLNDGETVGGYIPKGVLLGDHELPMPVYGEDLETLVGYQVAGQGFVPIAEYQPSPQPSAPPLDASRLEVLTAYLQAVQDRNCPAAIVATASPDIVPTTNALCASSARVIAFEIKEDPSQPSDDRVAVSVTITTSGGAFNLPDGPNAWSFTLARQPGGAWRVTEGRPQSRVIR